MGERISLSEDGILAAGELMTTIFMDPSRTVRRPPLLKATSFRFHEQPITAQRQMKLRLTRDKRVPHAASFYHKTTMSFSRDDGEKRGAKDKAFNETNSSRA